MGESSQEAHVSFIVGGSSACSLVDGPGSWPSGGQGHVKVFVQRCLWAYEDFR